MGKTTTVRVSHETKKYLDEIANQRDESLTAALDAIVCEYRRIKWLEAVADGYAELRGNPDEWNQEQEERALWEQTTADGLAPEGEEG